MRVKHFCDILLEHNTCIAKTFVWVRIYEQRPQIKQFWHPESSNTGSFLSPAPSIVYLLLSFSRSVLYTFYSSLLLSHFLLQSCSQNSLLKTSGCSNLLKYLSIPLEVSLYFYPTALNIYVTQSSHTYHCPDQVASRVYYFA